MAYDFTRRTNEPGRDDVEWRRDRDSNPGYVAVYLISSQAPSTTRPSLRAMIIACGNPPLAAREEIEHVGAPLPHRRRRARSGGAVLARRRVRRMGLPGAQTPFISTTFSRKRRMSYFGTADMHHIEPRRKARPRVATPTGVRCRSSRRRSSPPASRAYFRVCFSTPT